MPVQEPGALAPGRTRGGDGWGGRSGSNNLKKSSSEGEGVADLYCASLSGADLSRGF